MKWGFLPKDIFPRYLCCNADESEPGCFKDRALIDENPHQLIEGLLIAAYALQVNVAFIYIRGEYHDQRLLLERCVEEARAAGHIGSDIHGSGFSCDVIVHGGAGAYICGEETALIDSLEGYRGQPRLKPPFPAIKGLYGKPTVVNNVETLSNLPHIVQRGGAWFKALGTEKSAGTRLFCCSGHINRPGTYEMAMGTPIRELLEEECGGMWKDRSLKAFQPGGGSMQVLLPEHLDLPARHGRGACRRARRWAPAPWCSWTRPRAWSTCRCAWSTSTTTSRAASARRAARAPTSSRSSCTGSRRAQCTPRGARTPSPTSATT